jgi:prevent-host-death family protein
MKAVKKSEWQLQTAKNRFSEVVNRAVTEGAQTITRHGKPVVVVLSQEEFRKLATVKEEKEWSMLEHLLACPDKTLHKRIFRTPGPPRDVDFS